MSVNVLFAIHYSTIPGESVVVSGNCPALGEWEPERSAAQLEWTEGGWWMGSARLSFSEIAVLQYKYVVMNGVAPNWETGINRVIPQVLIAESMRERIECFDMWNKTATPVSLRIHAPKNVAVRESLILVRVSVQFPDGTPSLLTGCRITLTNDKNGPPQSALTRKGVATFEYFNIDAIGQGTRLLRAEDGSKIAKFLQEDVHEINILPPCEVCGAAAEFRVSPSCEHYACGPCVRESVRFYSDKRHFPASCVWCAAMDVENLLQTETLSRLVDCGIITLSEGRRFAVLQALAVENPHNVSLCPNANCGFPGVQDVFRGSEIDCPHCGLLYCRACRASHPSMSCEEFLATEQLSIDLVDATSKPCPKCHTRITHYRGHACHHIAPGKGCPSCGHHFCFVCMVDWNYDTHDNTDHGIHCDDRCDCPTCPDCNPATQTHCGACDGDGKGCDGRPSPALRPLPPNPEERELLDLLTASRLSCPAPSEPASDSFARSIGATASGLGLESRAPMKSAIPEGVVSELLVPSSPLGMEVAAGNEPGVSDRSPLARPRPLRWKKRLSGQYSVPAGLGRVSATSPKLAAAPTPPRNSPTAAARLLQRENTTRRELIEHSCIQM